MARPHGGLTPHVVASVGAAIAGRPSVVALGGGADSAVLLAAAASTAAPLRCVFVDHALEGSAALRGAAIEVARMVDVPISVLPAPVPDGPDLEARARAARYAAMESDLTDDEIGLTGHTMDDQAETVLMRLATGSGAEGLAGIPAERGPWRRPLLGVSKAELRAIADETGLPYADDEANDDDRFTRNRVRHIVMPALEGALGGHVAEGIARSSTLLRSDDEILRAHAEDIPMTVRSQQVLIPTAPLLTAHPAVASRVCRKALRLLLDGRPGVSRDVEAILATAVSGRTSQLAAGMLAIREGAFVAIGTYPEPCDPVDVSPGERFRWFGEAYCVRVEPSPAPIQQGGRFTLLDAEAVGGTMTVRGVRPGDTIDIEVGSTSVPELLRVHGVAPHVRRISPVVTVAAKIAAVVGVRSAAWAKPRGRAACLVIEREEVT